ncbi:hypothetical protein QUW17_15905, partial [Bacteroides gallinaceum]|uniref:hypothetical protein n=1 Tax=Bacteroides gallinaceum TaxID=1462571 RepID=UPI0025A49604
LNFRSMEKIIQAILDEHLEVARLRDAMDTLLVLLNSDQQINPFLPDPHSEVLTAIYTSVIKLKKENKEMAEKLANLNQ